MCFEPVFILNKSDAFYVLTDTFIVSDKVVVYEIFLFSNIIYRSVKFMLSLVRNIIGSLIILISKQVQRNIKINISTVLLRRLIAPPDHLLDRQFSSSGLLSVLHNPRSDRINYSFLEDLL